MAIHHETGNTRHILQEKGAKWSQTGGCTSTSSPLCGVVDYVAAVGCRDISIFPTYDGTRRQRGGKSPKTNNVMASAPYFDWYGSPSIHHHRHYLSQRRHRLTGRQLCLASAGNGTAREHSFRTFEPFHGRSFPPPTQTKVTSTTFSGNAARSSTRCTAASTRDETRCA